MFDFHSPYELLCTRAAVVHTALCIYTRLLSVAASAPTSRDRLREVSFCVYGAEDAPYAFKRSAVSCEGRELWAALDGALAGLAKVTFVLCDVDDTQLGGCKMGLREFVKERMPGVEGRGVVCFRSEKEEYPDCP